MIARTRRKTMLLADKIGDSGVRGKEPSGILYMLLLYPYFSFHF